MNSSSGSESNEEGDCIGRQEGDRESNAQELGKKGKRPGSPGTGEPQGEQLTPCKRAASPDLPVPGPSPSAALPLKSMTINTPQGNTVTNEETATAMLQAQGQLPKRALTFAEPTVSMVSNSAPVLPQDMLPANPRYCPCSC